MMALETREYPVFEGIDKHLDSPWYGLSIHDQKTLTYRTDVKPLSYPDFEEIATKRYSLGSLLNHRSEIRRHNGKLLDESDVVSVVLDGRVNDRNQGYLGDMIEASRLVNALRQAGKNVQVIASHTDIFEGTTDKGIMVVPIPSDIPAATEHPYQPRLLRYIGQFSSGSAVLFPTNANLPILLSINSEGKILNEGMLSKFNNFLSASRNQFGVEPDRWWKRGAHQLQALQIVADLIGLEGVYDWKEFPKAFLEPDQHAKLVAQKARNFYKCTTDTHSEGVSLLLHPGVATNGRKVELKLYPESRWKKVIDSLVGEDLPIRSLTIVKPIDLMQAGMASRLVEHADVLGIRVRELPERELKEKFGWTLGSFISFLQDFSTRNSIILGCDSMPAGHAGPAIGLDSIVLGSPAYNPGFYGPERGLVVMPRSYRELVGTKQINPKHITAAIKTMSAEVMAKSAS